jgi:hypothetical protein
MYVCMYMGLREMFRRSRMRYVCMCICMYVCMCVYVCVYGLTGDSSEEQDAVCVYVYMYVCVCVCVYMGLRGIRRRN